MQACECCGDHVDHPSVLFQDLNASAGTLRGHVCLRCNQHIHNIGTARIVGHRLKVLRSYLDRFDSGPTCS